MGRTNEKKPALDGNVMTITLEGFPGGLKGASDPSSGRG
jgi:hypothetical protein